MAKHTHVYIGKKRSCGCIVGGMVDLIESPNVTADAVADLIRCGLIVERVPVDPPVYMRGCKCKPNDPTQAVENDTMGA